MTRTTDKSGYRLLRRALAANGVFSILSGLGLALLGGALAPLFGISHWIVRAIGAGVILFGVDALAQSRQVTINRSRAVATIVSDFIWVAASVAVAIAFGSQFATLGLILLLGIAVLVEGFGTAQLIGLRRG